MSTNGHAQPLDAALCGSCGQPPVEGRPFTVFLLNIGTIGFHEGECLENGRRTMESLGIEMPPEMREEL